MIAGYAAKASVCPGDKLALHVSTSAARFRIIVYRWVGQLLHMWSEAWRTGILAPAAGPEADWQWPAYQVQVPAGAPSGVYIAHLQVGDTGPPHLAMNDGAVLFVVRCKARTGILYKIPLATYNAYNHAGGGCFYDNPPRSANPPGARLSFQRPGCGIGGPVFGAVDYYDPSSPRQSFAHWDAPFIRWLHGSGYEVAYCTDLDIHAEPDACLGHPLLLSVGHDEYWSEAMRAGVDEFIARGGNAAFFSGNVCWWRIHLVDGARAMVCHQGGPDGALDHWWRCADGTGPEDGLTGLSYRHGGGWWDGPRDAGGYTVQDAAHWVFAGTGLRNGEHFGNQTRSPLVGYECDGAPLTSRSFINRAGSIHPEAHRCGTPDGLHVLAQAVLHAGWQERPPREAFLHDSPHVAVMGIHGRGGTVFAAGTTDWAQVLAQDDPVVSRITRNVIDRLHRAPPAWGIAS